MPADYLLSQRLMVQSPFVPTALGSVSETLIIQDELWGFFSFPLLSVNKTPPNIYFPNRALKKNKTIGKAFRVLSSWCPLQFKRRVINSFNDCSLVHRSHGQLLSGSSQKPITAQQSEQVRATSQIPS